MDSLSVSLVPDCPTARTSTKKKSGKGREWHTQRYDFHDRTPKSDMSSLMKLELCPGNSNRRKIQGDVALETPSFDEAHGPTYTILVMIMHEDMPHPFNKAHSHPAAIQLKHLETLCPCNMRTRTSVCIPVASMCREHWRENGRSFSMPPFNITFKYLRAMIMPLMAKIIYPMCVASYAEPLGPLTTSKSREAFS